jgi:hypothetical protein
MALPIQPKKPPKPLRWDDEGALPCLMLTIVCSLVAIIHFINSDMVADFPLVALIVIASAPWLGHIFRNLGKDGVGYQDRDSGTNDNPPPDSPPAPSPTQSPNPAAIPTHPEVPPATPEPTPRQFRWEARKVLATLWKYQQIHFPNPQAGQWTFLIATGSPEYVVFARGLVALGKFDIAGVADNGQAVLTRNGIEYCLRHAPEVKEWPDTYDNFSNG